MPEPFYRLRGGLYEPQTPATNMWSRSHQNGVAVGGLLALLCDGHAPQPGMRMCRLTMDIQRAVPLQPLTTACRIIREGSRLQMIEAQILVDGAWVARATALRLRTGTSPPAPSRAPIHPSPEDAGETPITRVLGPGDPVETRLVSGAMREVGPGAYWSRINAAVVEGQITPALSRAVMAADLASGPASIADARAWSFANVDLSVYLARDPVDDWVFARSETLSAGDGTAMVTSALSDRDGPIGQSSQVLFMTKRA